MKLTLDKLIEALKELKDEDVKISTSMEPDIETIINWDGNGKQFIKVRRIIEIEDRAYTIKEICTKKKNK